MKLLMTCLWFEFEEEEEDKTSSYHMRVSLGMASIVYNM